MLSPEEKPLKSLRIALVLLSLGFSAALAAIDVAGVQVPDTATAEGKTLKLNGAGLRKKFVFKVYVAALYVETPSRDGAAVVAASGIKSMRLTIMRSLKGTQISEAIEEGFERNSKDQQEKLRARLKKLEAMIPDVKEGDEIVFTFLPDGVRVVVRGTDRGTIEGRDFGDALLSVWLGPNPVQEDLKKALLGG
jgi:hypothetical protein